MNAYPPSNRLLLSLPPRNLKQLAPKLEFICCEQDQILLDVEASIDHVFFPNSGVISVVAVYADGNVIEMATIGRECFAGVQAFLVPGARPPGFWYKFRAARRRCRAPRLIAR